MEAHRNVEKLVHQVSAMAMYDKHPAFTVPGACMHIFLLAFSALQSYRGLYNFESLYCKSEKVASLRAHRPIIGRYTQPLRIDKRAR